MVLEIMTTAGNVKQLISEDSDLYKVITSYIDAVLRDPDSEIAKCTEDIRLHPEDAMMYISRGLVYETLNNIDMAIADYTEAIRLDIDNETPMYYSRGDMYLRKGDLDNAIADYTEAVRIDPDFAEAYLNRGLAYEKKGSVDSAIADYTEALRLDPDCEEAQKALAALNKVVRN